MNNIESFELNCSGQQRVLSNFFFSKTKLSYQVDKSQKNPTRIFECKYFQAYYRLPLKYTSTLLNLPIYYATLRYNNHVYTYHPKQKRLLHATVL